jgi:hypothetical protein
MPQAGWLNFALILSIVSLTGGLDLSGQSLVEGHLASLGCWLELHSLSFPRQHEHILSRIRYASAVASKPKTFPCSSTVRPGNVCLLASGLQAPALFETNFARYSKKAVLYRNLVTTWAVHACHLFEISLTIRSIFSFVPVHYEHPAAGVPVLESSC